MLGMELILIKFVTCSALFFYLAPRRSFEIVEFVAGVVQG